MGNVSPRKVRAVILVAAGGGMGIVAHLVAESLAGSGTGGLLVALLRWTAALTIVPVLLGVYGLSSPDRPRRRSRERGVSGPQGPA